MTRWQQRKEYKVAAKKAFDWNSAIAFTAAIGLVLSAMGLFFTASQVKLSRQLAKSEFMREFYNSVQDYNDIQVKLVEGGVWRETASSGPANEEEWFRLQRYMGLLEQVDTWYLDEIMDIGLVDTSYSHRIKAIVTHPIIRKRLLEDEGYRWEHFNNLVTILEDMPNYRSIPYTFPSQEIDQSNLLVEVQSELQEAVVQ